MMKTGKNKKRRQQQEQQSGRPVLLSLYVARPARDCGDAATASAHHVRSDHHRLHGGGHEAQRGSKPKVDGRSYNRRAELLEYSRQLRALARQTTTSTAATPPPVPRPRRRDTNTVGVVRDAVQPAAEDRLSLAGRRLERSRSQQQIRQRCFGNGGWSWKRVLVLVFPFHSTHDVVGRTESKRPKRRREHDEASENNRNNSQKRWPAPLLVGKLTVSRTSRDHSGLVKKLMSVFRQRSR